MQLFEGKYVMTGRGLKLHFVYAMQLLTSGSHASVVAVSDLAVSVARQTTRQNKRFPKGASSPGGSTRPRQVKKHGRKPRDNF
jgi:hypothetical protein